MQTLVLTFKQLD